MRPGSPTHSNSTGSPQPGHRSGTGDGNTRSVRMAFATMAGPSSCSPSPQQKSLPSPRAASATPDIASEAPTPQAELFSSRAPFRRLVDAAGYAADAEDSQPIRT